MNTGLTMIFKNYSIDKLAATHYAEILKVWECSVRATHDFLNEADIQAYKTLLDNNCLDQLQLYGIHQESHILGFIGINDIQIRLLFVLPEARGMGIGISLINFVYQHYGIKEVDVNEQNTQAYDFYKYLGFIVTERSDTDAIGKPFPILSMKLP